jgi:hypothetical protein
MRWWAHTGVSMVAVPREKNEKNEKTRKKEIFKANSQAQ